jgi:hypothetical protein
LKLATQRAQPPALVVTAPRPLPPPPPGVPSRPVPSLLRDFSAPVKMTVEGQSDDDLVFMFANDSDPFNR